MDDRMETLRGYVNDMLAVERDLHAAFRRHKEDRAVKTYPTAVAALQQIEDSTDMHIVDLQRCLERLGTSESQLKAAVGAVLGAVAGIYGKIRDDRVSRMVRDDYTALSFAIVCYEMLHTTALALGNDEVAILALSHLRDYTPGVMALTRVVPEVITDELTREGKMQGNGSIARRAADNVIQAWQTTAPSEGAGAHP